MKKVSIFLSILLFSLVLIGCEKQSINGDDEVIEDDSIEILETPVTENDSIEDEVETPVFDIPVVEIPIIEDIDKIINIVNVHIFDVTYEWEYRTALDDRREQSYWLNKQYYTAKILVRESYYMFTDITITEVYFLEQINHDSVSENYGRFGPLLGKFTNNFIPLHKGYEIFFNETDSPAELLLNQYFFHRDNGRVEEEIHFYVNVEEVNYGL